MVLEEITIHSTDIRSTEDGAVLVAIMVYVQCVASLHKGEGD